MPQAPLWRRDPNAKKTAILHAARRLFTERGYANTTVRDIADRAGVNQSLIFRYFGSKHELFERSAPRHELINELFSDGWESGVLRMIRSFAVEADEAGTFIAALMRDARSFGTPPTTRQNTLDEVSARIAQGLAGPDAQLLADLILAWVIGIGVLYDVVHRPSVVDAGPKRIAELVVRAASSLNDASNSPGRTKSGRRRRTRSPRGTNDVEEFGERH
jgi:AcrR family transcriptional regulator